MTDLLMLVAARGLGALRGTEQYDTALDAVANAVKEAIPSTHLEPELGQVLIDVGERLRPTEPDAPAS